MRRVALVTTSRADYGIQSRLIRMLQGDDDIDFSLVVSGTHLSERHGMTIREIEGDGIRVAQKLDIGIDQERDVARVMAKAIVLFADALGQIKPDVCVILGDRYEMLAASLACTLNNIVIAHLYGGETTEGAIDEVFRHSITKAAYLHFTSCEAYRRRVIQMGESPERVLNVGSLGVENIHSVQLMTREALEEDLRVKFSRKNYLVTFHPATYEKGSALEQIDELLAALGTIDDALVVFTHPNADAEGDVIAERIAAFAAHRRNAAFYKSLGAKRYLSLAKVVDAVIGNSSSGIVEVPSLRTATINIGSRQRGRVQAKSTLNCEPDRHAILEALAQSESPEYRRVVEKAENPYFKAGTAENILRIIKSFPIENGGKKKFFDLECVSSALANQFHDLTAEG